MQYSHSKEAVQKDRMVTDWYCAKCGVFNFKRRYNCFKCYASREESEKGGEGSDEISNILTKKIMFRNLDALTNEEGVLTIMQELIPQQVSKISKILVCRDLLTQTSRGICYLNFDNLVDSMNAHNSLKALDPPLQIDGREVMITYCVDTENRQVTAKSSSSSSMKQSSSYNNDSTSVNNHYTANTYQYTLADVPRLAEYSAAVYATNPAQHDHYMNYYSQFYTNEIAMGQYDNLPTITQLGETQTANSGAAVALSAIQRQKKKMNNIETTATALAQQAAAAAVITSKEKPKGDDGRIYPTPNVSLYQYDETSGYYYDPTTGLYYDAHSQYYYNNETNSYLFWNPEKSTYCLAPTGTTSIASFAPGPTSSSNAIIAPVSSPDGLKNEEKKERKENKHDKVKVAKKIVKDMEKWAKQLNQKKDMTYAVTPAVPPPPTLSISPDIIPTKIAAVAGSSNNSGYADVGFSILEKKENKTGKLSEYVNTGISKLVSASYGGSDSDDNHEDMPLPSQLLNETNEKDYVDFEKLTCLLCKRAFQSQDILNKHLKMSNLHKENLQKYNLTRGILDADMAASASYRDRAKERRLKYGECDPPPPNRSKERFEKEMKKVASNAASQSNAAAMPIGENNVGNRLLQKMGWSEGQGLGRSNQGRTSIIEADSRNSTAGLGNKSQAFVPGDDYKSYIKRMMKSRYDNAV